MSWSVVGWVGRRGRRVCGVGETILHESIGEHIPGLANCITVTVNDEAMAYVQEHWDDDTAGAA